MKIHWAPIESHEPREMSCLFNPIQGPETLAALSLSLMAPHAEGRCQSKLGELVFTVRTSLQKSWEKSSTAYACMKPQDHVSTTARAPDLIPCDPVCGRQDRRMAPISWEPSCASSFLKWSNLNLSKKFLMRTLRFRKINFPQFKSDNY